MVCTTWRGDTPVLHAIRQRIYIRKLENLKRKKIISEMISEKD
jgi:hypothetical protein